MKRRFFLKAAATVLVTFSVFKRIPDTKFVVLYPVEFSHWIDWPNLKPETSKLTEDHMNQAIKYMQQLDSSSKLSLPIKSVVRS